MTNTPMPMPMPMPIDTAPSGRPVLAYNPLWADAFGTPARAILRDGVWYLPDLGVSLAGEDADVQPIEWSKIPKAPPYS